MKITWWGCAWGIWEGQSCHCNLNNTKKTVGVLLYSKNICCIACPLAVLKPDLEIFKAVKSSQSSFKGKLLTFPPTTLAYCFCYLGGTLALLLQSSFLGSAEGQALLSAPQWLLLFLLGILWNHWPLKFQACFISSVLSWLQPPPGPGSVHGRGVGSRMEFKAWAFLSPCCYHSLEVSQRASAGIKDDLSAHPSSFHIRELCELILLIFLHIAALSQLGTMCPSEQLSSYSSSRSSARRLIIQKDGHFSYLENAFSWTHWKSLWFAQELRK